MENLPIGYRLKRTFHAFNDAVKRKVYRSNINFTNFCILTYLNRNLIHGNNEVTQKDICSFTCIFTCGAFFCILQKTSAAWNRISL